MKYIYNVPMEKPGNWFAIAEMWKKPTKQKKIKERIHILVFSSSLCKSTTWFLDKRIIDSKWIIPNNQ